MRHHLPSLTLLLASLMCGCTSSATPGSDVTVVSGDVGSSADVPTDEDVFDGLTGPPQDSAVSDDGPQDDAVEEADQAESRGVPCSVDGDCEQSQCLISACEAGLCRVIELDGPCEDGDPCTTGDTCSEGNCVGGQFTCIEVCGSGGDEDLDGLIDCRDPDCWMTSSCDLECRGEEALSCGQQLYDSTVPTGDSFGVLNEHCGLESAGNERIYTLDVPDGMLSLDLNIDGEGIVAIYASSTDGVCAAEQCLDAAPQSINYVLPDGPSPDRLYVVVDTVPGEEANFSLSAICHMPAFESCLNGVDDDGDGAMDCDDDDCVEHPICGNPIEDCDNGVDDDLDGLVDCEDPNCASAFDCAPPDTCAPMYDLTCGSILTETIGAFGSTSFISDWSCEASALPGSEMTYRLQLPAGAEVELQLLDAPPDARLLVVENAETCSPAACIASGADKVSFTASASQPYAAIVDTAGVTEGTFTLAVSCVGGEQCDNVIDDDLDGAADCQDSDCFGIAPCLGQVCQGDTILFCDEVTTGTLSAEGTIDLSSCGSTGPAGETVALFTSAVPTQVTFTATGSSSPKLFALDASGICDTGKCVAGGSEQITLMTPAQANWYLLIDGQSAGDFAITANCAAAELNCADGLDGDGDGATDCDDTDCLGASGCAPSCPVLSDITCGSFPATTGQDEPQLVEAYGCPGTPSMGGAEAAWRLVGPETSGLGTSVRVTLYDPIQTGAHLMQLQDGPTCDPSTCIQETQQALAFELAPGETTLLAVDRETSTVGSAGFVVNCHGYENACLDGMDGDGDGLADCADPDCANLSLDCPEQEYICQGGLDDDGDGLTDCEDEDCIGVGECPALPGSCVTDLDSFCNEPLSLDTGGPDANTGPIVFACDGQAVSSQQGTVSVVYIGEGDPVTFTLTNPSAPARLTVVEANELECDPLACVGTSSTQVTVPGVKGQRYIVTLVATSPAPVTALLTTVCEYPEPDCLDGIDDDNDGAIDCLDPGCAPFGFCQVCLASDGLSCGGSINFTPTAGPGATSVIDGDCGPASPGPERTFEWTPELDTNVTLTSIQADTRFHIFAQGQQPCDANACVASGTSPVSFAALAQVTYMIVADTVSQGQAPNTVSMACDVTAEVCDNGVDDDLDNAVDCEDVDCKLVGDCGSNEICEDGEDNDLDGYTDCEDITCLDLPVCAASEDCTDGVDNDDDGYTDCQDNQCSVDPACGPN